MEDGESMDATIDNSMHVDTDIPVTPRAPVKLDSPQSPRNYGETRNYPSKADLTSYDEHCIKLDDLFEQDPGRSCQPALALQLP